MLSDNKLVDVRGVFERCTCDERSVIVNLYSYKSQPNNDIKVVVASLSICGVTGSGSEGSTLPKILLIRHRVLRQHLVFKVRNLFPAFFHSHHFCQTNAMTCKVV